MNRFKDKLNYIGTVIRCTFTVKSVMFIVQFQLKKITYKYKINNNCM